MAFLPIIRYIALGTTVVFSIIVLGMGAHMTSLTNEFFHGYFTFAALAIATAVLTITSVPVMLGVDFLRRGAFTSMVVVELSWLGVLWVLWLATGGTAADANSRTFPTGCGYRNQDVNTVCNEFSAIMAFAFLNWIILMGYTITLLVFSIIRANRGHNVWTSSVKETSNLPPSQTTNTVHAHNEKVISPTENISPQSLAPQYPPQSMAPGYSSGYGDQYVPQPGHAVQPPQHSPYPQV